MTDISVINYRKRREERLAKRGYKTKLNEYRKTKDGTKVEKPLKAVVREDAPDDKEQTNGSNGNNGGGGGHGNTRLPYGLCKRFGIEILPEWSPRDAWDALAGEGISASGAYTRLKQGRDPGTPIKGEEPPKKKEPKVSFETTGGETVDQLETHKYSWDRSTPYRLMGKRPDGRWYTSYFPTKGDMLYFLREKGVEEIRDPDTDELVNPVEMELPKVLFTMGAAYNPQRYSSASIGLRDGRYAIVATDMDGKKKKINDFSSLAYAKQFLEKYGVSEDDVKLSPALKKREAERKSWLDSDKVEYIVKDGVKFGDLKGEKDGSYWGSRYRLTCSDENGDIGERVFPGRTSLIKYLKEQGVERAKVDGEYINPQEFEIPKTVATIRGKDFQKLELKYAERADMIVLSGTDIEGEPEKIDGCGSRYADESYDDFIQRIKDEYNLTDDQIEISEETQKAIDEKRRQDAERVRRQKEFEEKAIEIGGWKYMDVTLEPSPIYDGEYKLIGYDKDGDKTSITSTEDIYGIGHLMSQYKLSPDQVIMDDKSKEEYQKYVEFKEKFDATAVEIGGEKYSDLSIEYRHGEYRLSGKTESGRKTAIANSKTIDGMNSKLSECGKTMDTVNLTDSARDFYEEEKRIQEYAGKDGYHKLPGERMVYKDIRIEGSEGSDRYTIVGTDIDGDEVDVKDWLEYDDAMDILEGSGIDDYKVKIGDKISDRPTDGMRKVLLMRTEGGYTVSATVGKGETKQVASLQTEDEAREWLRNNGVDDTKVKTRGMNPNDAVARTHSAKSLSNFDRHRMEKLDGSYLEYLDQGSRQELADMLTEVFAQGQYRVARSCESFGGIIENGYKSQVETGTGGFGAAKSKDMRKDASKKFFGHGGLADTEYEKCGYLGYSDEDEDWDDSSHPIYGGSNPLTYTLKKDRMKDRTTYTWGDSLNERGRITSAGYGGDSPTIEGMTAVSMRDAVYMLRCFRDYKDGKITYWDFFKKIRTNANNHYVELQFHGPVTVEDIEQVSWNDESTLQLAFERMKDERRKRVIHLLQQNNVKLVYRNEHDDFVDGWDWLKKKYPSDFT